MSSPGLRYTSQKKKGQSPGLMEGVQVSRGGEGQNGCDGFNQVHGRGIGEGIVKRLYNEGSEIIIADIRKELAENLISSLNKDQISFFQTDLAKEEDIKKLIEFTNNKWGDLDFLINNLPL